MATEEDRHVGAAGTDLRRIVSLALDLSYYRTVDDDGGLGAAAWIELRDAVDRLPEADRA